ncbi:Transmembrane protein 53 [Rhynchospora pubera]|uniref:Transmembrane protein 53 n=1 Tax=Rhynchospora pubera TaxID=906938 RepID=A0AAV8FIS2_9POAL|nr:Transmembrane protein 53 [Rhynchospora pubera]
MWGRYYWGKKTTDSGDHEGCLGIVVLFAWLSSKEKHVKPYLNLFSSLHWSSFVCHSEFATLFFPDKAASLADGVIKELAKELKKKPMPVVFASFSGGPKGCTYKVLQLINGVCKGQLAQDDYQLVRDCLCGLIFDSSPVDFKSDIGTKFILHPTVLKISRPPRVLSWMAGAVASGLDTLFIRNFEEQRADFWQTLYNSANVGPFLILCSEDDDLAPYSVIADFVKQLEERGADVSLMSWKSSRHVGHYKYYPDEYRSCVADLLQKAVALYSSRKELNGLLTALKEPSSNIPSSIHNPHKTASTLNKSLTRAPIDPVNQYSLPSSMEYEENQGETKPDLLPTQSEHNFKLSGVLGQVLFDVCDPKDVEGWDLNLSLPIDGRNSHMLANLSSNYTSLNPIKCIRRSRL